MSFKPLKSVYANNCSHLTHGKVVMDKMSSGLDNKPLVCNAVTDPSVVSTVGSGCNKVSSTRDTVYSLELDVA